MIQALPDYAVQLAVMESSLQELRKLVNWGWTYAVIWKIGPDHRTPVWYQSYLNDSLAGAGAGRAQRFESIYRQCQFTPARPGYAYVAWMRQSPLWWTRLMKPILTDKSKESFLEEVGIQTLVCFPGRAIPDGTGYCVELACTALVSETDALRMSIQDFLNTSIDPYISSPPELLPPGASPGSLDMDSQGLSTSMSTMAALAHQTSAILTDITSQASMGEDEALEAFGNILRPEEPYPPWTMSSSHYVSAGLPFDGYQDPSFNYDTFQGGVSMHPQATATEHWASSSKGKDILVEEAELVLATGKELAPSSPRLNLLQQELLEKLRSPPAVLPAGNPKTLSPGYVGSLRAVVGKMPPGHISSSPFRPHNRHRQLPRVGIKKKRRSLIFKWATTLAPNFKTIRNEMGGAGGSSFDGLSPGTDVFDPRSPNSVAHDMQAAVAHKIAERNRRMKFSHKLQTLISIVPMVNKKKDKVSVLTSTIDYIRQLNARISTLKKVEDKATVRATATATATSLRRPEAEEGGAATTMDREPEELSPFSEVDRQASSSSPIGGGGAPAVVVVEGAPGDDTWVIRVEANNRSRSFIQLLNVLLELELGVVTVDYGSLNGRFHANICVKNSRNSSTSSGELQAMLLRVVEACDSSVTGSD